MITINTQKLKRRLKCAYILEICLKFAINASNKSVHNLRIALIHRKARPTVAYYICRDHYFVQTVMPSVLGEIEVQEF